MKHKDNSARTNRPYRHRLAFLLAVLLSVLVIGAASVGQQSPSAASSQQAVATIHIDTAHPLKTFDPDIALGTSIDILPTGVVDKIYTPEILKESLSAGWGPITYRQNTELQGAAWHWNPRGTWSDAAHQSGYFTGSAELGEPIRHSLAYPLPLRGNTGGDGRSRGKYSRMTDGDPNTYWKSNPYLKGSRAKTIRFIRSG